MNNFERLLVDQTKDHHEVGSKVGVLGKEEKKKKKKEKRRKEKEKGKATWPL